MIATNQIRIGLIGCGAVAEIGHLPAVMANNNCKVSALIDKNTARLEQLSKRCGPVFTSEDYTECLEHIDAAIIALPHHLHASVTMQLLDHGIHVLVDKPMAMNSKECDDMISAAERSGAVLSIGHMRRHLYSSQLAKAFIDRGLLGKILSFHFAEGSIYNWPVTSDFFFKRQTAGGGVLIDTGAHTLDLLHFWLGDINELEYFDDQRSSDGVEADCLMNIITVSGVKGIVELSRTRNLRNTALIIGDLAVMEVNLRTNHLTVYPKNSPLISKNNLCVTPGVMDLMGHKEWNNGAKIKLSGDSLVGKHSIECNAEEGGSSGHIFGTRDTKIMMPVEPLTEYTTHVYLKGISGDFNEVPLLLRVGNADFKFIKNSIVYLTNEWKRYSLTFTSGELDDAVCLGVWKKDNKTPIRWVADGFQIEKGQGSGYYGPQRPPIIFESMGSVGPQSFTSLFHNQIADFVLSIKSGHPPAASGTAGKTTVEMIERLYTARKSMEMDWEREKVLMESR